MRRTLTVCRTGLSLAAALVLLTACGGSGNDEAESSATSEATSSAPETTSGADSEFCTAAAGVQEDVAASFGGSEQGSPAEIYQRVAEEIREIEAPAELASDWTSFAEGIEQIAAAAQIDFNDQAAVATFQQKAGAIQQQYGSAFTNVTNYLSEECELTETPTESSAPTS